MTTAKRERVSKILDKVGGEVHSAACGWGGGSVLGNNSAGGMWHGWDRPLASLLYLQVAVSSGPGTDNWTSSHLIAADASTAAVRRKDENMKLNIFVDLSPIAEYKTKITARACETVSNDNHHLEKDAKYFSIALIETSLQDTFVPVIVHQTYAR